MEWIKTALPLIGVLIGWILSESGKIYSDKRQDKRKLKKLLFFLLELRYHFAKELSFEMYLDRYIKKMKVKASDRFGIAPNDPILKFGVDSWKPLINLIDQSKFQDEKFDHLNNNIDGILIELAEVFPILAYELNGQHNIKDRLNRANNYFSEVEKMTNEYPLDIKEWIKPKLTQELLNDLDDSIEKIAKKINKETLKNSKNKISQMNFQDDDDDKDVDKFMDEYLDKVSDKINENID